MQETWVQSLGPEDPLEEGMETPLYELDTTLRLNNNKNNNSLLHGSLGRINLLKNRSVYMYTIP